jgi:hypothetical protein
VKALEAARANNVNMIFLSGNEAFWKTRWEPSLDASKTPYRTLVCYKQTQNNVDIDSSEIWTGLFRDRREMTTPFPGESANPYNHEWQVVQPENALTGTIFTVNYNGTNTPPYIDPVLVPANQAKLRLWRTSRIATVGGALDIPMGPEWDEDLDNGFRPAGLVRLSETTKEVVTYLQDVNNVFARNVDHPSTGENALPDYTGPQNATHSMTMYRGSRNGLVFSAGMSTWSHALVPAAWETTHPRHDFAVKQATVNLLADMGVSNPLSFEDPQQQNLHLASPSTDTVAPTTSVSQSFNAGTSTWTFSGTATDTGGKVAGVEISYDGGVTWKRAGLLSDPAPSVDWTYSVVLPQTPTPFILTRTVDDSFNMEAVKAVRDSATNTVYVYGASAAGGTWDNDLVITKSSGAFTVHNNGTPMSVPEGTVSNLVVQLAIGKNRIVVADAAIPSNYTLQQVIDAPAQTLSGFLIVRGGIGNDTVVLDHIKVGGVLEINGKTGADAIVLTTSVVGGTAMINTVLNGNSSVGSLPVGAQITINNIQVAGGAEIKSGNGNDRFDRGDRTGTAVTLRGGSGDDTYAYNDVGDWVNDTITETPGGGRDTIDHSASPSPLVNFSVPTLFEGVRGSAYADSFVRGAVDQLLEYWGGGENDSLSATGGTGGIRFHGEAGNDLLIVDGMSNNSEVSFWGEAGNDTFKVRNATRNDNGSAWNFVAGGSTEVAGNRDASANWLMVESGNSYVQSDGVGGWLDTKVTGSASLWANNLRQNRVIVGENTDTARIMIKPSIEGTTMGTSIVDDIAIGASAQFDLTNNDLIIRTTAATKDGKLNDVEGWITSAQNGVDPNFVTKWDGVGLTSSFARSQNVGEGIDLVGLGAIRNSDLDITTGVPGSAYTTWSGQVVTPDYILVKFTYTGDGNLDGRVTFDDYAAMDSAFFDLIEVLGWSTGDVNYDGVIDFNDYSIVDQAFFFQHGQL